MVSSGSPGVPGSSAGVAGGRPGAVGVPGGGLSVGSRRRTLRSARRVKSGPRPADGGRHPRGAAGLGNGERRKAPRPGCVAGQEVSPALPEGKDGRAGRGVVPGGDPVRALAVAGGGGGARPCCRPAGRAGLPPGTAGIHPRLRPPRQVARPWRRSATAGRRWPAPTARRAPPGGTAAPTAARPGEGTPGGGQRVTLSEGTGMAGGPACRRFADSLHKSGFEGLFSPGHPKIGAGGAKDAAAVVGVR